MADVICNKGKEQVAKGTNNETALIPYTWMALGTGSAAAAATDTALQTETAAAGLARAAATCSYEADYKSKWVHSFTNTSAGSVAVHECGIHNKAAAEANDILLHSVFGAAKNIANNETLQVTITVAHA